MVIWINGAFGAGKTQTAYELHRRMPDSYVYDPENAGFFIRENLPPGLTTSDFQDYPMWRSFNVEMLDYIASRHPGSVIVPMTITSREYYHEVIGALSQKHELKHFILCAEKETLLRRLASRLETRNSWAARQIDRCIRAFQEDLSGYRIHTDDLTIRQVAEEVAALAGIPLPEDRRSPLRRTCERIFTQLRHIR